MVFPSLPSHTRCDRLDILTFFPHTHHRGIWVNPSDRVHSFLWFFAEAINTGGSSAFLSLPLASLNINDHYSSSSSSSSSNNSNNFDYYFHYFSTSNTTKKP